MNFARITHTQFLPTHSFADVGQVTLGAMPVKAVPLAQDHLHICLGARKINGTFCLSFQAFNARFKLRHNIKHTFEVTLGAVETLQGIVTARAI